MSQLRTDGPTLEEWVEAGYAAEGYPPQGYAVKKFDQRVVHHDAVRRAWRKTKGFYNGAR